MPEQDVSSPLESHPSTKRNGHPCPKLDGSDEGSLSSPAKDGIIGDSASLLLQCSEVSAYFNQVLDQMDRAASAMRVFGEPPDYRLVLALGECQRRFLQVRRELIQSFESRGIPTTESHVPSGLKALEEWISGIAPVPDSVDIGETSFGGADKSRPFLSPYDQPPSGIAADLAAEPKLRHEPESRAIETRRIAAPVEAVVDETEAPRHLPDQIAWVRDVEPAPVHPEEPLPFPREDTVPDETWAGSRSVSEPLKEPSPERDSALAVLDRMLSITTREGSTLPSLLALQDQTRGLRDSIAATDSRNVPPEAERLAKDEHPLASLVKAVEASDDLTDGQWADLHALISETFGRELAVAVARHRLVFSEGNTPG